MKTIKTVNKVIILGYVISDPIIKETDGGKMAYIPVLTKETDKNGVEHKEKHDIIVWGNLVSVIEEACKKDMVVCVEGRKQTKVYSLENGVSSIYEVVAKDFVILDKWESK